MDEIGALLKEARESSGVSIKEACNDLNFNELNIENIEAGKIGSFQDVHELKNIIREYAKYLGLDVDKIIDEFNEYLFEYTSKIPVKELEKTIELQLKEDHDEAKIKSPYTKKNTKIDKKYIIFMILLILALMFLVMGWAIRQVTIGTQITSVISYNG